MRVVTKWPKKSWIGNPSLQLANCVRNRMKRKIEKSNSSPTENGTHFSWGLFMCFADWLVQPMIGLYQQCQVGYLHQRLLPFVFVVR